MDRLQVIRFRDKCPCVLVLFGLQVHMVIFQGCLNFCSFLILKGFWSTAPEASAHDCVAAQLLMCGKAAHHGGKEDVVDQYTERGLKETWTPNVHL